MDETVEGGRTSLGVGSVTWGGDRKEKERTWRQERESFPYITDKALDIQTALKHDDKTATLISQIPHKSLNRQTLIPISFTSWTNQITPVKTCFIHTIIPKIIHLNQHYLTQLTQVNKHNPGYKAVNWRTLARVCKIWKWLIWPIPFDLVQLQQSSPPSQWFELRVFSGWQHRCDSRLDWIKQLQPNQRGETFSFITASRKLWVILQWLCSALVSGYFWLIKQHRTEKDHRYWSDISLGRSCI